MIRVELHLTIAGAGPDEPTYRGAQLNEPTEEMLTELLGRTLPAALRDALGARVEVDRFEVYEVGGSWPADDEVVEGDLVYGDDPPPGSIPVWAWPDGKLHSSPPPVMLGPPDRKRVTFTAEGLALVDPAEVEAGDWRSELMAFVGEATGVGPPPDELRPQLDAIAARVRSGETTVEEAVEAVTALRSRWAAESSRLEERPPDRD